MTRMYYFIIHLSIADLLTAFFTVLPEIIWTSMEMKFYNDPKFKFNRPVGKVEFTKSTLSVDDVIRFSLM